MKRLLCAPLVLALIGGAAAACAVAMNRGGRVAIASETALIIYDDKTQTEHFIRRGTFETKVPYFGFLVPTPSKPEVAEVDDAVFATLADWTKPEVIKRKVPRPAGGFFAPAMTAEKSVGNAAPGGVEVLGSGRVGDLDYTILKADDARALKTWLEAHSYETRPDLTKWAEPYAEQGWVFTAFQMVKPEDRKAALGLTGKAVRLSFKTDRPFYPYQEPEGQREAGAFRAQRLLRVFYVGTTRVEGKLGDEGKPWPGQAVWSNELGDKRETLAQKSKGKGEPVSVPQGAWLTEFEDHASPRPGTADLFFGESKDQTTLKRPPVYQDEYVDAPASLEPAKVIVVALLGAVVLGTLGFLLWRTMGAKAA